MTKLRVLFTGGCHVDGASADGASKLSGVVLRELEQHGYQPEAAYLVPVRMSHPRRLKQECVRFRPDVLVLQGGHAETIALIQQFMARKLRLSSVNRRSLEPSTVPLDGSTAAYASWLFRRAVKSFFHAITGHKLLDVPRFAASLDSFFARLDDLAIPLVLVMSPLPCADPVVMYYRRKIEPYFAAGAAAHRWQYLNVLPLDEPGFFRESIHLSYQGHAVIGRLVTDRLLQMVEQSAHA